MMQQKARVLALLCLLAIVVAVKLGQGAYRWYAFADERAELQAMSTQLEETGVEVIRTELAADSLKALVDRMDRDLASARSALERYERLARRGTLAQHLYPSYRADLDAYNDQVVERNARLDEYRAVIDRNHAAVARYNGLAQQIRELATRIGDPYYAIPSPVEAALRRGVLPAARP